ncbi:hypothetical protein RZY50_004638 [Vibrio parahaemolyticus]|nr:hypothetical protein [Vibrio parahaemolyticus]
MRRWVLYAVDDFWKKVVIVILITAGLIYVSSTHSNEGDIYLNSALSVIASLFLVIAWELIYLSSFKKKLSEQVRGLIDTNEKKVRSKTIGTFSLSKYCVGHIERDLIPQAWKDLCWDINSEYIAVNYENDKTAFPENWATIGLSIQNTKALGRDIPITKIFIVDSLSELQDLKDIIESHIEHNIVIYYIQKKEIELKRGLKKYLDGLSLDFSLLNGDSVFVWNLDKNRECLDGNYYITDDIYKRYQKAYKAICLEATKIHTISDIDKAIAQQSI